MSKHKQPEAGWYVRQDHPTQIMDCIGNHVAETVGRDGDEAEARAKQIVATVNQFSFLLGLKDMQVPKYTRRCIVWNANGKGGVVMILIGYCPQTLGNYIGMAQEVVKAFPDANLNDAGCHQVVKSNREKGFTLMLVPIKDKKREVPGFEDRESFDFNY